MKADQHAGDMLIRQWLSPERVNFRDPRASVYSPLLLNTAMQPVASVGVPTLVGADEQIVGAKVGAPPPIAAIATYGRDECDPRPRHLIVIRYDDQLIGRIEAPLIR